MEKGSKTTGHHVFLVIYKRINKQNDGENTQGTWIYTLGCKSLGVFPEEFEIVLSMNP